MLSCLKQGEIHLEDLDASIKLIMDDNVEISIGLFCETTLVLVQGVYFGHSGFGVSSLMLPFIESRYESLLNVKRLDFFGGPNTLAHPNTLRLLVSQNSPSASILIISDFWLD